MPAERCLAEHPLSAAHSATVSLDGRVVYVVCGWNGCAQRRVVAADVWEAREDRRRASAAATPDADHA